MISMSLLEEWPFSSLATTTAILITVYAFLYHLQCSKSNPNEPPIIASSIPFIGPLLGMVLQGGRYYKDIGVANRDKPIFTLPVPRSRIYIVTDPSLAAAVQRASKALSFTPLVPDITKRVLGLDAPTVAQIRQNLDPEPGAPRGFLADMHDKVYSYLGPGELLSELSFDASAELGRQVNDFAATLRHASGDDVVDLLEWMRHFVTVGTAHFLYGPQNPVAVRPELESAFWDFVHGLGLLLIDVCPSVTAKKPYQAREALVKAFIEYLDAGHQKTASKLVQYRLEIPNQYGWSTENTAREEVSFLFAGIINTAVATFWVVLQIFASQELLQAVRTELEPATKDEGAERTLSIEMVSRQCPRLQAVFRECLRVGSDNFSTRLVKNDTLLADKYFLKGDSVVQVAAGVIHADKSIWGEDADDFNPARFLKMECKQNQVHPAAFRSFGGGKTLCPGRHFATTEILMFVAMIVLSFDMEAVEGGRIEVPQKNDRVLPIHILEPKAADTPKVRVKLREGGLSKPLKVVA